MTYLELVQRLNAESGASGEITTVTGQVGESLRMVRWANTAYQDIQLIHTDWYWLRGTFSFSTTIGQESYTPAQAGIASRFANWDRSSVSSYLTTVADEGRLDYIPWETYRDLYGIGSRSVGKPVNFSVHPTLALMFDPVPDQAYTVRGEYFKMPQDLTLDADIPEMPEQFHMAIVYRAMMLYGRYEAADEVYQDAKENYQRFIGLLEKQQMPTIQLAGPLA